MKKSALFLMIAGAAGLMTACNPPAANVPAVNTANANAAKPAKPEANANDLLALDKQANEAYFKGDGKFFEGFLSDKFTQVNGKKQTTKADVVAMTASAKCDVKEGWKLEDPQISVIDPDTVALSYKGTFDGSCMENGKTVKLPSPVRAATVFVRNGDKWAAVFHGENPIVEAKAPAADDKKAEPGKEAPKKDEVKKEEPKKEEPKKEEPKKEAPKKEEPKKEEVKKDDKAANGADSTAAAAKPEAPKTDANTDALMKLHQSGWDAFKAKDAKAFDAMLTSNFAFVDPAGTWRSGKTDAIKQWTETMKCEGITKTSVSDGFATALSPTVELFSVKGTADGTCDGRKNGDLQQTTVYVKEGDAWHLAFMYEEVAKK